MLGLAVMQSVLPQFRFVHQLRTLHAATFQYFMLLLVSLIAYTMLKILDIGQ
jgi:hypothetical protein